MASFGTPYEGRDSIIGPAIYTSGLNLLLYTNTKNSLDETTVLADLNEPSGTGYAQISLGGTWAYNNGIVTYDHGTPDNPQFTNTGGSDWTGDVTGAAMTDGLYVLHFRDFTGDPITVTPNYVVEVDILTLVGA